MIIKAVPGYEEVFEVARKDGITSQVVALIREDEHGNIYIEMMREARISVNRDGHICVCPV